MNEDAGNYSNMVVISYYDITANNKSTLPSHYDHTKTPDYYNHDHTIIYQPGTIIQREKREIDSTFKSIFGDSLEGV